MKWMVGATTKKRSDSTFLRSLKSLHAAGFSDPVIARDEARHCSGAFPNWVMTLQELYQLNPHADAYLMVQDDVTYCRGIRDYLDATLWPSPDTGCVTLYTSRRHHRAECEDPFDLGSAVCHEILPPRLGYGFWGACALAFPARVVPKLLGSQSLIHHRREGPNGGVKQIDAVVGRAIIGELGLEIWGYCPSLAQHIGKVSTIGAEDHPNRSAAEFAGENYLLRYSRPGETQVSMEICDELTEDIRGLLRTGIKTFETGCGRSTEVFRAGPHDHHVALEHEKQYLVEGAVWAPLFEGDDGISWYAWKPTGDRYDIILIDGPQTKPHGRHGIMRVIGDMVHAETVIFVDDTHEVSNLDLAERIAMRFNMDINHVQSAADDRRFAKLTQSPARLREVGIDEDGLNLVGEYEYPEMI